MRWTPSLSVERFRVSRDEIGTMPISARPMHAETETGVARTPARRSSLSDSPTGRAMPNLSPEPVGSAVVTTIQSGSTVVPGGASAVTTPRRAIRSSSDRRRSACRAGRPCRTRTAPRSRSRRVVVNTVASRFGRLTSAFASRTTLPLRSTVTSSRLPLRAILRRVGPDVPAVAVSEFAAVALA